MLKAIRQMGKDVRKQKGVNGLDNKETGEIRAHLAANIRFDINTEMVHGRARAPSRQTLRMAANEVRSRVAPRGGTNLLFYFLKREFLRGT